jgi:hypothetical protein
LPIALTIDNFLKSQLLSILISQLIPEFSTTTSIKPVYILTLCMLIDKELNLLITPLCQFPFLYRSLLPHFRIMPASTNSEYLQTVSHDRECCSELHPIWWNKQAGAQSLSYILFNDQSLSYWPKPAAGTQRDPGATEHEHRCLPHRLTRGGSAGVEAGISNRRRPEIRDHQMN